MAEAFDRIPQCVLIVDRDQRLVFANNSGRELIKRKDGIELGRDGRLKTWFSTDQRRLNARLGSVSSGDDPGSEGHRWFLQISRPSGGRPLAVMMSQFKNDGLAGVEHQQQQLAILFISDLEQDAKAVENVLCQMHGLTAAEARIASMLADGRSLNEICEILEIKQNTARSHLKQVFSKTGTSRQGELVKLILSGPANLR
jgi:DNA-binding CsgD family transcriptional regulator